MTDLVQLMGDDRTSCRCSAVSFGRDDKTYTYHRALVYVEVVSLKYVVNYADSRLTMTWEIPVMIIIQWLESKRVQQVPILELFRSAKKRDI